MTIWRPSRRGKALDLAGGLDVFGDLVEQLFPQFLVRHFAPTEAQGNLYLVAFFEELEDRAHLDFVVMGIGSGAELDFLDLDDLLVLRASASFFCVSYLNLP